MSLLSVWCIRSLQLLWSLAHFIPAPSHTARIYIFFYKHACMCIVRRMTGVGDGGSRASHRTESTVLAELPRPWGRCIFNPLHKTVNLKVARIPRTVLKRFSTLLLSIQESPPTVLRSKQTKKQQRRAKFFVIRWKEREKKFLVK